MDLVLCFLVHNQGWLPAKDINKRELILRNDRLMRQSSFFDHAAFDVFDGCHYYKCIAIDLLNLSVQLADLKSCYHGINNIFIISMSHFTKATLAFIYSDTTAK